MSMRLILAILSVVLVLGGTLMAAENNETMGRVVGGNDDARISDEVIGGLEIEAAKGSAHAAIRLANHHNLVTHDYTKALQWQAVAAENGSIGAMFGYANMLSAMPDLYSQTRAAFWLKKVMESGEKPYSDYAAARLK